MKKIIVLTVVAIASQAVAVFAGEPVVSSKQVIAPLPASVVFCLAAVITSARSWKQNIAVLLR